MNYNQNNYSNTKTTITISSYQNTQKNYNDNQ